MTITDSAQRAYRLVEELRAEVDFEIDDVISEIVRNLPEEYFVSLSHEDQLTHLKALLAISICNLNDEITLRSENGRHIAVVARQNYSGQLARIVANLPDDLDLLGAKIFTSKTHDFIIDLFDFKQPKTDLQHNNLSRLELADLASDVARITGENLETISNFIDSYPQGNEALRSAVEVSHHFTAFLEARMTRQVVVRWTNGEKTKLTVACASLSARELFLKTARAISELHLDIDQAFLYDFPLVEDAGHIAVASFVAIGDLELAPLNCAANLKRLLSNES